MKRSQETAVSDIRFCNSVFSFNFLFSEFNIVIWLQYDTVASYHELCQKSRLIKSFCSKMTLLICSMTIIVALIFWGDTFSLMYLRRSFLKFPSGQERNEY